MRSNQDQAVSGGPGMGGCWVVKHWDGEVVEVYTAQGIVEAEQVGIVWLHSKEVKMAERGTEEEGAMLKAGGGERGDK